MSVVITYTGLPHVWLPGADRVDIGSRPLPRAWYETFDAILLEYQPTQFEEHPRLPRMLWSNLHRMLRPHGKLTMPVYFAQQQPYEYGRPLSDSYSHPILDPPTLA